MTGFKTPGRSLSLQKHQSLPIGYLATLTLCLAGCSGETERLPVHPAHGTLTISGEPAPKAMVVLRAAGAPDPKRKELTPHGEVGADGKFRIGTYTSDDGAPAGNYFITITWPQSLKDPLTGDDVVEDRLLGRFDTPEKTGIKVTIKEGENKLDPIVIESRND